MTRTKALTEFGPLLLFFATNMLYGIMPATVVLVVTTVAAVIYALVREGRVPWMPVVGAVLVSIFAVKLQPKTCLLERSGRPGVPPSREDWTRSGGGPTARC